MRYDVIVVGGGHNGLVAAAYLAKAGLSVRLLERRNVVGGATQSAKLFPDFDAWISRYAYLISLLPPKVMHDLGLTFQTMRRRVASCTPYVDARGVRKALVISNEDQAVTESSLTQMYGDASGVDEYREFATLTGALASIAWPTLLCPLQSRQWYKQRLATRQQRAAWDALVEQPLGRTLESVVRNDGLRGLLMTDAKIGVLTHGDDETLLQNRCFLYHVIGQGTGEWRVPVGGMKSLVQSLVQANHRYGTEITLGATALRIVPGEQTHHVSWMQDDHEHEAECTFVLVGTSLSTLKGLLRDGESIDLSHVDAQVSKTDRENEGAAVKVNMLLRRLPKVITPGLTACDAFTGSLHIDEGYEQMKRSYQQAERGRLPDVPPFELYCHTLTDPSILSREMQDAGYHTLTLFGLDTPYRAFTGDHDSKKARLLGQYLDRLDEFTGGDFRNCIAIDREDRPCIEVKTPKDLEIELGLDRGNIFHTAPSWFFTDNEARVGKWGVETPWERILLAGSAALRGGAVSGVPGHNAAMCVLERLRPTSPT